jgi:hypothetical protein
MAACDGPYGHSRETFANLQALALHTDSASGRTDACTLNASWVMPEWPTTTRTDTTTVHFARQALLPGNTSIFRDTIAQGAAITLSFRDSLRFLLELPPPFADTLTLRLDSVGGTDLSAAWRCPTAFPLATDSALVANGYQAASLTNGTLHLARFNPVD